MRKICSFTRSAQHGFTLLEVMVVMAIITGLAGLVLVAINPGKQLADSRNAQRVTDANSIVDAVNQYSIDNGVLIPTITTTLTEICKTGAESCAGLVDLSALIVNERYLVSIPFDPNGYSTNGTGYQIQKNDFGRITVVAPHAENNQSISVSR